MISREIKRWGSHLIIKIDCLGLFDKITGEFQKLGNHFIRQIAEHGKQEILKQNLCFNKV